MRGQACVDHNSLILGLLLKQSTYKKQTMEFGTTTCKAAWSMKEVRIWIQWKQLLPILPSGPDLHRSILPSPKPCAGGPKCSAGEATGHSISAASLPVLQSALLYVYKTFCSASRSATALAQYTYRLSAQSYFSKLQNEHLPHNCICTLGSSDK